MLAVQSGLRISEKLERVKNNFKSTILFTSFNTFDSLLLILTKSIDANSA